MIRGRTEPIYGRISLFSVFKDPSVSKSAYKRVGSLLVRTASPRPTTFFERFLRFCIEPPKRLFQDLAVVTK
jgi:hypothetical protein